MQIAPLNVPPLDWQVQQHPQRLALISHQQQFTYAQLQQCVLSYAAQLQQQGVTADSRIACSNEDMTRLSLLLLAAHYVGCSVCPINHHQPPAALARLVQSMSATHYWGSTKLSLNSLRLTDRTLSDTPFNRFCFNPKRACSMVFTSGTSSHPKAVVHNWHNHYYSALGSQKMIALKGANRWLLSLPLYHIGGQAILWRSLLAGTTLVVPQQKTIRLKDLKHQQISHLSLVPTQLYRLLALNDFSTSSLSLEHLLIGGAACPKNLIEQALDRGFKVYSSYGSSELSSQLASCAHHLGQSAYQVLDHREARIEQGELWLKGDTLAMGYWQQKTMAPLTNAQGWFASGDMAQLDKKGLSINGRMNNMFICAGENVQPEEIEQALVSHPNIEQAVVLPREDKEYGQVGVALIQGKITTSRKALEQHLRLQLAPLKLPFEYYQLPQQSSLKPSRSSLLTDLNAHQLQPVVFHP